MVKLTLQSGPEMRRSRCCIAALAICNYILHLDQVGFHALAMLMKDMCESTRHDLHPCTKADVQLSHIIST